MRKVLFEDLKLHESQRFKSFIADITINTADLRQIDGSTTKVSGLPEPFGAPMDIDALLRDSDFIKEVKKKLQIGNFDKVKHRVEIEAVAKTYRQGKALYRARENGREMNGFESGKEDMAKLPVLDRFVNLLLSLHKPDFYKEVKYSEKEF